MFHGARRAKPQAKRMIQAHDSNKRLHCRRYSHEHVRMNTREYISATLMYRGEGVDSEIIFIIAIHKPAPQKLLQWGRYLLLEIIGVVLR